MSKRFRELMEELPPERQAKIEKMAEELRLGLQLQRIREELELSQKQVAESLNIKQPSIASLEKRGDDVLLSSIKKYVEAMGGTLGISVGLPTGKTISFDL